MPSALLFSRCRTSPRKLALAAAMFALGLSVPAEDSEWARPYLQLRRGELNYKWGLQDMWGFGFGWNLNRHWGVELAVDTWESSLFIPGTGDTVGEEAVTSFAVQGRYRYPLWEDRLVPYLVAGIGGAAYQFNDRKDAGLGLDIDADGSGFTANAGIGLEYFVADNVALGVEAKYLWFDPVQVSVGGREFEYDASDWVVTVGLRLYLAENDPQPLVRSGDAGPVRLYFGGRAGGSFILDDAWTDSISLEPEVSAWGGVFNQHFGLCFGANFGAHWGIEVAADGGEYTLLDQGTQRLGEYALVTAIPQVRYSWPLRGGRWVPYASAGVGVAFGELNDLKPPFDGSRLDAGGLSPAASAGVGLEWFIARNLSFHLETQWKQVWGQSAKLDGVERDGDFSQIHVMMGFRMYLVELGRR
jgi:opacity protein-like surface antigen